MTISVINQTDGKISNEEIQTVIRAVNRQIKEDFKPYWSIDATLRLEGKSTAKKLTQTPADLRGDAIIYIEDKVRKDGIQGYHELNEKGIPFGYVYLDIAKKLKEPWSVTFSHEVLELIGDSETNLLAAGPHPNPKNKYQVFHWHEMCDAVQTEIYEIDGVKVSNFVLPLYFTSGDELKGRNDFLGTINPDGTTLKSFGVNPGGYIGFFDPVLQKHDSFFSDQNAQKRSEQKGSNTKTRRAIRYQKSSTKK